MRPLLAAVFALGLGADLSAAPPPRVTNARVEKRSGGSGLLPLVKAELAARSGPFWLGWSVAATERSSSCCWSGDDRGGTSCRGCSLEGERRFEVQGGSDEAVSLEGSDRIRVLLRAEGGRVGKIRMFSEDCPVVYPPTASGHLGKASEVLGVHRNTLTRKIREYGLEGTASSPNW